MTTRARTATPELLARQDHRWMTHAACTRHPDLPWTDDEHRVDDENREAMAHICRACPVRAHCRRYANRTRVSAGFWDGDFRGGAYTGDLFDLLAQLDVDQVQVQYEPYARRARHLQAKALAS